MADTQSPHTGEPSGRPADLLDTSASSPVHPYGCGRPAISETPSGEQVTEADREIAWPIWNWLFRDSADREHFMEGDEDEHFILQAFAKHRRLTTAARQPELTREELLNIATVCAYEAGFEDGQREARQPEAPAQDAETVERVARVLYDLEVGRGNDFSFDEVPISIRDRCRNLARAALAALHKGA